MQKMTKHLAESAGRLLFVIGIITLSYVGYEAWWTSVQADRAEAEDLREIGTTWAATDDPAGVPEGLTSEDVAAATSSDGQDGNPYTGWPIATAQEGTPPVPDAGTEGTTWGVIHTPAFDQKKALIAEGVDKATILDKIGAGHYPTSQMPGQVGNFALAGHRTTYSRPFHDIARLTSGDPVIIETEDAWYVYRVESSQIVTPSDTDVIAAVPNDDTWSEEPTEQYMTMTACHPLYSARERYVVHLRFDYWAKKSDGAPVELVEAP